MVGGDARCDGTTKKRQQQEARRWSYQEEIEDKERIKMEEEEEKRRRDENLIRAESSSETKRKQSVERKAEIRVIKTTGIKEQESRKKIEIDVPIGAEAIQEQEKRPRKMKRPTWKIKMEIKNKTGQIPVFHEIFLIFEIGHSDFKYISKNQNQGTQRFSL